LRSLKVSPGALLTQESIHEGYLRYVGALTPSCCPPPNGTLKQLYKEELLKRGVQFLASSPDESCFVSDPDPASRFLVPQFQTEFSVAYYRNGGHEAALDATLSHAEHYIRTMGFGRSYSGVYVTNDLQKTCETIGIMPSIYEEGLSPPVLSAFPRSRAGFPQPFLVIQYGPTHEVWEPFQALHACLVHEAIHLVQALLWQPEQYFRSALPLGPIVTLLACEVFAQMQTTAMLGNPYLYISVFLSDFVANRGSANASPRRLRHRANGDPQIAKASSFLRTFPWLAASWVVPQGSPIPSLLAGSAQHWDESLTRLAEDLKPIFLEIYDTASLSNETCHRIAHLLAADGPCGPMFEKYSYARLAAHFQAELASEGN
jgi:hypothetical protein